MQWLGLIVVLVWLTGCGTTQKHSQPSDSPITKSSYYFDYEVTNAEPIALLRVLDDGGNTYFQFRSNVPDGLVVSAETTTGDAIVPHESMGNFAILHGVYRHLSVPSATLPISIKKRGDIPPMANLGPVVLPKKTSAPTATVKQESISSTVVEAARHSPSETFQIRFARNSAVLNKKARSELAALVTANSIKSTVEIKVRPFYPNRRASVRLAKARADAIRRKLIGAGIDSGKIHIDYEGGARPMIAELSLTSPADPNKLIQEGNQP